MATLLELKRKIQKPLDMEDELFVEDQELLDYINEGIKECEAVIHNLYEDYFLTSADIALTSGTSEYSMPSDIYGRKIRSIIYDDGNEHYEVLPIDIKQIPLVQNTDIYRYRIFNSGSSGLKIKLFPAAQETSLSNVKIYYIRDAAQLASDSDETDIPEFDRFIVEYARVKILEKEMSNPMLATAKGNLERIRQLMVDTLQQSKLDSNNEINIDTDMYDDFYSNYYGYPYIN